MSSTDRPITRNRAERRFGLTLATGLTVAGTISLLLGHAGAARIIWIIGGLHLLGAIFAPRLLVPSRFVVELIVKLIGRVVATVVLSVFFFAIFTPFSFLWRLIGKDNLRSHPPHWREVSPRDNDPETLRKLF